MLQKKKTESWTEKYSLNVKLILLYFGKQQKYDEKKILVSKKLTINIKRKKNDRFILETIHLLAGSI